MKDIMCPRILNGFDRLLL